MGRVPLGGDGGSVRWGRAYQWETSAPRARSAGMCVGWWTGSMPPSMRSRSSVRNSTMFGRWGAAAAAAIVARPAAASARAIIGRDTPPESGLADASRACGLARATACGIPVRCSSCLDNTKVSAVCFALLHAQITSTLLILNSQDDNITSDALTRDTHLQLTRSKL